MSADSVAMATTWHNYDPAVKSKPRFSYKEIKTLLQAVIRNRHVLLSEYHKEKFNSGASAEAKKQTWQEITDEINGLGENHREVRQIMKKWADLKCDGRRRVNAFHPDRVRIRKKQMGPIERTVHKILMMVPRGGDSDIEIGEDEDLSKLMSKVPVPTAAPYSYLSVTDGSYSLPGANYDLSPLSSPEKDNTGDPFHSSSEFDLLDDGDQTLDFEEMDDSFFSSALLPPSSSPSSSLDPLPASNSLQRKPVHTYSRTTSNNPNPILIPIQNNGGQNHIGNHSYSKPPPLPGPSTSSSMISTSSTSKSNTTGPPKILLTSSPIANTAVNNSTSSSTSAFIAPLPPGPIPTSSNSNPLSNQSERLPAGASSSNRARDNVAKMASQSLEQQRAGRMLLTSVSRSMETLAQSVQLLVESQQEFVQDSLLLQRETVDILKEFSNTALTMLRDNNNKANNASAAGQMATRQHHPASHF